MENDFEQSLKRLGEWLKEAKIMEEDLFKNFYEKAKPLFVKCLKAVQSYLSENQTLMLNSQVLGNTEEGLMYGLTFFTSQHIIVQQLEVTQGKVFPIAIQIFSTEEFVGSIDSSNLMHALFATLLELLKAIKSESLKPDYYV